MMPNDQIIAIILAAGKGTRMKSDLPKVLHEIHNRPLLQYVISATQKIKNLNRIITIVGHQSDLVKKTFKHTKELQFVEQNEQLGTGHAVMQASPLLENSGGQVLVLCGDTPILTGKTLQNIVDYHKNTKSSAVVLTADLDKPMHYGRIIRSTEDNVLAIREFRDCSEPEKQIKEINSGVYCFNINDLLEALQNLTTDNKQKEYYLTDTLEILSKKGKTIKALKTNNPLEITGINTVEELETVSKLISRV